MVYNVGVETKKKKLTEKEQFFVKYYIQTLNGSESARKAGYSPKTAANIAAQNLQKLHIQEAIQEEVKKIKISCDVDTEFVIGGLKEVALRCRQKIPVMEFDYVNKRMVQKTDELGNAVWAFDSGGANKSLELLGKHLTLFSDKLKIEGESFAAVASAAISKKKEEELESSPPPIAQKIKIIKKNG